MIQVFCFLRMRYWSGETGNLVSMDTKPSNCHTFQLIWKSHFGNYGQRLYHFFKFSSQNCQCISCNCFTENVTSWIREQNIFSHSAPPHFLVNSVLLLSVDLVLFSSITLRSSLSRYKTKSGHVTFLLSFRTIFSLLSFFVYVYFNSLYFLFFKPQPFLFVWVG